MCIQQLHYIDMKFFLNIIIIMAAINTSFSQSTVDKTIFQFIVKNLEGEEYDFSVLKGKKVMTVSYTHLTLPTILLV